MTKVLRPVPTFDQLVNLPVPQLTPPERTIETSRPDPNVFDFHEGQMGQQQNLMHMHAMHQMMMRQEAQAQGADISVMRDLTHTAQELNRTMQDIAGRTIPGRPGRDGRDGRDGRTGPVIRVTAADGSADDTRSAPPSARSSGTRCTRHRGTAARYVTGNFAQGRITATMWMF